MKNASLISLVTLSLFAAGCSDSDDGGSTGAMGTLTVLLEAEDTITQGLDAGEGVENIRDGWQARFDKYLVGIGGIDVDMATEAGVEARAPEVFVVDMVQVPAQGLPLWTMPELREGRWNFNYVTAVDGATRHDTVDQADFDAMVASDLTYLISGTLTKSDGVSCPPATLAQVPAGAVEAGMNAAGVPCYENTSISFELGAEAETVFGPCEIDEQPGFSITGNTTQSVAATVHGDHGFFNGFPEGDEGGVTRLAQWWADSDLNLDGVVTQEELMAIAPADLSEFDDRYQLGGSPITPVDNMWTYFRAQLKTQGHYQGEGECPVDGVAHSHGDDHDDDHGDDHDDDHGDDHDDDHGDDHDDDHGHGHD
ncbi:MAG: hypothetical protein AAGN82_30930 [Myxococcota bacterium]